MPKSKIQEFIESSGNQFSTYKINNLMNENLHKYKKPHTDDYKENKLLDLSPSIISLENNSNYNEDSRKIKTIKDIKDITQVSPKLSLSSR